MPTAARPTTQELIYMHKLDRKNVLFFSLEETYLILLSIYPYKKDITKSKYYWSFVSQKLLPWWVSTDLFRNELAY